MGFAHRPSGRKAQTHHTRSDFRSDFAHLLLMQAHLRTGLVHALQRGAGKFELTAGLQADRCAVLREADDMLALHDRFPAEAAHAFEQRADAGRTFVRKRPVGLEIVNKLLVFRADAPFGFRLRPIGEIAHEVVARLDRSTGGLGNGHRLPSFAGLCPYGVV